jgi:hypothetical protein
MKTKKKDAQTNTDRLQASQYANETSDTGNHQQQQQQRSFFDGQGN